MRLRSGTRRRLGLRCELRTLPRAVAALAFCVNRGNR